MNRHRNLSLSEMAYSSSDSTVSYYNSDSDETSDGECETMSSVSARKPDNSSSKIEIDKAFLEYLLERGQKSSPIDPARTPEPQPKEKKKRSKSKPRSSTSKSASSGNAEDDSRNKGPNSQASMNASGANLEMIRIGARKLTEVGFSQDQSEAAMRIFGNYQDALDGLLSNQMGVLSTENDDVQSTHSSEACSISASDKGRNVEPTNTVWVGNVLPQITNQELHDIFSNCGKIVNLRILRQGNYAFIEYSDTSEASKAVKTLYGFSYKNCKLIVRFTHSKNKPKNNPEQLAGQKTVREYKVVCVRNVPSHVGNVEIKELFANAGTIKEMSFERHKQKAFIEYNTSEEARAAVTRFTGFTFKGGIFAVKTVASLPSNRMSGADQHAKLPKAHKVICISGMPTQIGNMEIKDLFANAGAIKEVKYERNKQRVFIEYSTPEEARAAVTRFNAFEFKGAVFAVQTVAFLPPNEPKQPTGRVEAKEAVETKSRPPNLAKYDLKRIWVGGLHPEVKDLELINIFCKYGTLASYRFLREKMCAFINYESEEAAQKAVDNLQGYEVRGQKIWTSYVLNASSKEKEKGAAMSTASGTKEKSTSYSSSDASSALWVGNVIPPITDLELIQLFCGDAKIKSYRIMRDWKCAFFNYHSEADATKTLRRLQGYNLKGHKLILDYTPEERGNSQAQTSKMHAVAKESKTNLGNPDNLKSVCVSNLTPAIKEEHIIQLFSRCGPIISSKFVPEHKCIFLNYGTSQEATRVMRTFQNYSFRGTVLNVRFSKKGGAKPKGH